MKRHVEQDKEDPEKVNLLFGEPRKSFYAESSHQRGARVIVGEHRQELSEHAGGI